MRRIDFVVSLPPRPPHSSTSTVTPASTHSTSGRAAIRRSIHLPWAMARRIGDRGARSQDDSCGSGAMADAHPRNFSAAFNDHRRSRWKGRTMLANACDPTLSKVRTWRVRIRSRGRSRHSAHGGPCCSETGGRLRVEPTQPVIHDSGAFPPKRPRAIDQRIDISNCSDSFNGISSSSIKNKR